MAYWLMKSEPDVFSVEDLRKKKIAGWDGVRNYQARNNLRAMRTGDLSLFYHSRTKPPAIAGLMEIVREAYPDPTADEPGWVQVDVKHVKTFKKPLALDEVKKTAGLHEMVLLNNSRLSVQPVTPGQWTILSRLLALALLLLFSQAPAVQAECIYFRTSAKLRQCREVDPSKKPNQNPYQDTSEAGELVESHEGPLVEIVCECEYSLRGSDIRCDLDQTVERTQILGAEKPKEFCRRKHSLCKTVCTDSLP